MKKSICFILCTAICFIICGCKSTVTINSDLSSSNESSQVGEIENSSSETSSTEEEKIELSLEDKISRLFIVKPEALNIDQNGNVVSETITAINPRITAALQKYKVSGVILFDKNILNESQLKKFNSDLKDASELPFFISVDEEGGNVSRLANHKNLSVANTGIPLNLKTEEKVKSAYQSIASYLDSFGFNLNFAPVADVYTNPNNKVIGSRAFATDPEAVSKLLVSAMKGHALLPHCVKHFPGHGDTSEDTHNGTVTLNKTWEELLKCEIIPFKTAIENGCDMIMTSHITLPKVTNDNLPTSLSYDLVTGKLRNELGYDGVVITDSMAMGAITKNYSTGAAAVTAIKAGADIVLCTPNIAEAHSALLKAVKNGEISEERIDESIKRIDALFKKYNIS